MPRYIDADALLETEPEVCADYGEEYGAEFGYSRDQIANAPTISPPDEVRGVGKWIRIPGFHLDHEYYPARYQCDQCKHFVDSGDDKNYCPNCGAKMEVSEDA